MFITQFNRNYYDTKVNSDKQSFFCLVKNNWNDYGYETTFQLDYYVEGRYIDIGIINILNFENSQTRHIIPDEFQELTDQYVSLGGSEEFYENLINNLGKDKAKQILVKLKDISIIGLDNNKYFNIDNDGIQKSFFRSTKGRYLYNEVLNKYFLSEGTQDRDYKFTFKAKIYPDENEIKNIEIDFSKNNSKLPNRIFTIVGKNGVGKTRILNQLAESLFDSQKEGFKDRFILDSSYKSEDKGNIPIYNKVIAISFSVFDKFYKGSEENYTKKFEETSIEKEKVKIKYEEETKFNNYVYIGLHKINDDIFNKKELKAINKKALEKIIKSNKKDFFIQLINESNILNYTLDSNLDHDNFFEATFSSGQNVYLSMICRLLSEIEEGSLVFLDEPELYLHPNAISNLARIYYKILEEFKSYAIMCTHSPILIQEMPSNFVRKIIVLDNNTINYSKPNIETFGANISEITADIFNVLDSESLYKSRIKNWILQDNFSESEVLELFNNDLSFKAQLYISSLIKGKD